MSVAPTEAICGASFIHCTGERAEGGLFPTGRDVGCYTYTTGASCCMKVGKAKLGGGHWKDVPGDETQGICL